MSHKIGQILRILAKIHNFRNFHKMLLKKRVKVLLMLLPVWMNENMYNSAIFCKKVQKGKKGYTKGKLEKKSCFFQNFDFFTKFWILPFFDPFYPFFGEDQKVTHVVYIPHQYHVNRPNRKKRYGKLKFEWQETTNFAHKSLLVN